VAGGEHSGLRDRSGPERGARPPASSADGDLDQ